MDDQRMRRALTALLRETKHDKFRVLRDTAFGCWDYVQVAQRVLRREPLLQRLQFLQRHLDELDVEGIMPIYEKHREMLQTHDLDAWQRVIRQFKERAWPWPHNPSTPDVGSTAVTLRLFPGIKDYRIGGSTTHF